MTTQHNHPPLPLRHLGLPKLYSKQGVKALSIAAGFQCTDGVVLCADTEITEDASKRRGSKIVVTGDSSRLALFAFVANDVLFAEQEIAKLGELLASKPSAVSTVDFLKGELLRTYKTYSKADKDWVLNLLLVVREEDKASLYQISGANVVAVSGHACSGWGQAHANAILDVFFQDGTTVDGAARAAAIMLGRVKKCAQTCGDLSHVYSVFDNPRKTGRPFYEPQVTKVFDIMDPAQADNHYSGFLAVNQALGRLLTGPPKDDWRGDPVEWQAHDLCGMIKRVARGESPNCSDPSQQYSSEP
jgi:20S proteasome alpha/beta subunit